MPKLKLSAAKIASLTEAKRRPKSGQVDHFDLGLPGFGIRISKTGGSFFVFYRVDGKKLVRDTIGTVARYTLSQAREMARSRLELVEKGEDPRQHEARQKALAERHRVETLGALALTYRSSHLDKRRSGQASWSAMQADILTGGWESLPIRDLTRRMVMDRLDELEVKRGPFARNRRLSLIRHLLNWALDREVVTSNVATRIKQLDEPKRDRILTDAELVEVWRASDQLEPPAGQSIKMLILTALRRNEVLNAEMTEIDFKEGVWRLPASRMKAKRSHLIPLSQAVLSILDTLPDADRPFVFLSPYRRKPSPLGAAGSMKSQLDKLILDARRKQDPKAKAPAHWVLHDLRRTARSGFSRLRVPRDISEMILAHTAPALVQTYDLYGHIDEMREALDRWAHHVFGLLNPTPTNVVKLPSRKSR